MNQILLNLDEFLTDNEIIDAYMEKVSTDGNYKTLVINTDVTNYSGIHAYHIKYVKSKITPSKIETIDPVASKFTIVEPVDMDDSYLVKREVFTLRKDPSSINSYLEIQKCGYERIYSYDPKTKTYLFGEVYFTLTPM